jgi:DNA polymerase-3 subunit beta
MGPDGLIVEASGSEDAKASEAMDCTYTGEPMTIAFNHQYLLDGLQAVGTPTALFSLTDPKRLAALLPSEEDGEPIPGYWYVIMPVRVGT